MIVISRANPCKEFEAQPLASCSLLLWPSFTTFPLQNYIMQPRPICRITTPATNAHHTTGRVHLSTKL